MKLLYEGKAKQLFECENNDEIYVHYKNSATAFNGVKKEEFEGKGVFNNTITSLIFEYLEKSGVETHFIKKVNETDQICKHVTIIPLEANLVLVDFKIEFGKDKNGKIILADEISPDTCRLWDKDTNEKLDKDRFRRDLGSVMEAYEEVLRRLEDARA